MADINYIYGALSLNYDPARSSPPLPPVPHNSFSGLGTLGCETESDLSGSSVDSHSSLPSSLPATTTHMSPSIATLAKIYNFPPLRQSCLPMSPHLMTLSTFRMTTRAVL
jgi:hypothetical protein